MIKGGFAPSVDMQQWVLRGGREIISERLLKATKHSSETRNPRPKSSANEQILILLDIRHPQGKRPVDA